MRSLGKFGEHLLWALVMLAALLIILWFVLNFLATKTPAPLSTAAAWTAGAASGSSYGL